MTVDNQTTTIDKLGTGENNNKDEGGNITIMEIKENKKLVESASEEIIPEKTETVPVEEPKVETVIPVEEPKTEEPTVEEPKPVTEEPQPIVEETAAKVEATPTTEAPVVEVSLEKQIEELKLQLENAKLEIEKLTVEAKLIKEELGKRLEAEKAAALKIRRDELGEEFATLITDEDIMDDLKFENAKLKKEVAKLKNVKPADLDKGGLDCGAKIEKKDTKYFEKQNSIRSMAFPVEETK
jgi:hypothetical protein